MTFDELIKNYFLWFILISLFCCALERIKPWRNQVLFRNQIFQDLFWMILNIYFFSLIYKKIFENPENEISIFFTIVRAII